MKPWFLLVAGCVVLVPAVPAQEAAWETFRPAGWIASEGTVRRVPPPGGADPGESVLYRRDRYLRGDVVVQGRFVLAEAGDAAGDGGFVGVALAAESWFESGPLIRRAIRVGWSEDGRLRLLLPDPLRSAPPADPGLAALEQREVAVRSFRPGEEFWIEVRVTLDRGNLSLLSARARWDGGQSADLVAYVPTEATEGFCGIAAGGRLGFEAKEFRAEGIDIESVAGGEPECVAVYASADTLRRDADGKWRVRFLGAFRRSGGRMEIRVADAEKPEGGWGAVAVAGGGEVVPEDGAGDLALAVADVALPGNPADQAWFYTVWRDGRDVTGDARTEPNGAAGRLPRLAAPYRVAWFGPEELRGLPDMPWPRREPAPSDAPDPLREAGCQLVVRELDPWRHPEPFRPVGAADAWARWRQTWGSVRSRRQLLEHWVTVRPVAEAGDAAAGAMVRRLAGGGGGPVATWRFPAGDVAWTAVGEGGSAAEWADRLARETAPVVVVAGGAGAADDLAAAWGGRSGVVVLGGEKGTAGITWKAGSGLVVGAAEAFGGDGPERFLEFTAEPERPDGKLTLAWRGGGSGTETAPGVVGSWEGTVSGTGKPPDSRMPGLSTLPGADVRVLRPDGRPVRSLRSAADGTVPATGLPGVAPGTRLLVLADDGTEARAHVTVTVGVTGETSGPDGN
jgi:hypothetical protein